MQKEPPYGWQDQMEIRDFIEDHLRKQGWTFIGAGYGFGVADVQLCKNRDGMVIQLDVFVNKDHVDVQVTVMEEEDDA